MKKFDVVILTEQQYLTETKGDAYSENVVLEDAILAQALKAEGLTVYRTNWDNPNFDWNTTKSVIFRAIWDYQHKFTQFMEWLKKVKNQTILINDYQTLTWNIDKHYLLDLQNNGVNIVPSTFVKKGSQLSLQEIMTQNNYTDVVIKPTISAGGRDTIAIKQNKVDEMEKNFQSLIEKEDFIVQPFQQHILTKGEVTYVLFDGKYQYAILKKAKQGEFRVQDDFGGSVHDYTPSEQEITFAEEALKKAPHSPIYARVDIIWDNNNALAVSELELIEPELWFRNNPKSANDIAIAIKKQLN